MKHSDSLFLKQRINNFNQTVWAILIGTFVVRSSYFMAWPFLVTILNTKLIASPIMIGLIFGVSSGVSSISGFYIGYLSDKVGRKPIIMAGCVLSSICYLGLITVTQVWHFFVIMAGLGLARPTVEVVGKAILGDSLADAKDRELALNLRYFLVNVAGAFGPLLGLVLGSNNSRVLFLITAVTYVAYLIWIGKLVKLAPNEHHSTLPNFKQTFSILAKDRIFLTLMIADFLLCMVYCQFNSVLPQMMAMINTENVAKFVILLTVVNCATVTLFQFPMLKLLERFLVTRRTQMGFGLLLLSQFLFIFIDKASLVSWGAVFFIFSLGEVIAFPTINVTIDTLAKPGLRGSYFGASGLADFGMSIGPVVGAMIISELSPNSYFGFTTLLCVIMVLLCSKLIAHEKQTTMT